jgi:hypothetical protein
MALGKNAYARALACFEARHVEELLSQFLGRLLTSDSAVSTLDDFPAKSP